MVVLKLLSLLPQRAQAEPNSCSTNTGGEGSQSRNHKPQQCVGLPWGVSDSTTSYYNYQIHTARNLRMGQLMGFWGFGWSKELKKPGIRKSSFPSHTHSCNQNLLWAYYDTRPWARHHQRTWFNTLPLPFHLHPSQTLPDSSGSLLWICSVKKAGMSWTAEQFNSTPPL